ncbi:MAG: hypothetical protein KIT56_00985 [Gammaproteobacteria bacterium]|nr:hypothetical protein [Gammaproteobacteria bacterium]MCW5582459.1 hypothetical protein [Gammaproteobacteria bacterium]
MLVRSLQWKKTSVGRWKMYRSANRTTSRYGVTSIFFKRYNSTLPDPAWVNVTSPYRLTDYLGDDKVTLPSGVHFTCTNPDYTFHSLTELRQLYVAIGTNKYNARPFRTPKEFIVFKPKRVAKQLTGILAATELKIEDDQHFVNVCKKLEKKIQPVIADSEEEFVSSIKEITCSVRDLTSNIKHYHLSDDDRAKQFLNIEKAIKSRLERQGYSSLVIHEFATKILIDDCTREFIQEKTYDIVVDIISDEIKKQHVTALDAASSQDRQQIIHLLPQFDGSNRLTQMMAGGPATGKSMITKQFAAKIKCEYGLSLSDFAFISTDRFRLLFLEDSSLGSCKIMRGVYTQDEAREMTQQSILKITKKVEQNGFAPNVFMEMVAPMNEEIKMGLSNNGKVRIALTSYPPAKAVEGNFKRFQDTQERLPPVSAVLGGQKSVSEKTPKIVKDHVGQDVVMTLHDTDELLHGSSDSEALIAVFDCQKDKIIVRDINKMLDFVRKSHINPVATCPDTVYPNAEKIMPQAIIASFLKNYGHKEIVFIDPSKPVIDESSFEKNAYAVFTPESGLAMINEKVFDEIFAKDRFAELLFTVLMDKDLDNKKVASLRLN